MFCGRVFHSFAAEWEKERSNSADRDLGIDKRPFSVDLKVQEWVFEIGLNKLEIYAGVKLLSALYAKTGLLYINLFGIGSQLNCSNM